MGLFQTCHSKRQIHSSEPGFRKEWMEILSLANRSRAGDLTEPLIRAAMLGYKIRQYGPESGTVEELEQWL